jgi:hypothetical protein
LGVATILVATLLAACSSPLPTSRSGPAVTSTPNNTGSPGASAAPQESGPIDQPTPVPNYPEGEVPASLRRVDTQGASPTQPQVNRFLSEGPLAIFTRSDPPEYGSIYLVDLQRGTTQTAYRGPAKTEVWYPGMSDRRIAWLEYRYPTDAAHPADHWWLKVLDLRTGKVRVLAHAPNPSFDSSSPGFAALLSMDAERVAYGLVKDGRWSVVVRNIAGSLERSIQLEGTPVDLAISGPSVVWTEGVPNLDTDSMTQMKLRLSTDDVPAPATIARFAYYLALDGRRLVWLADEAADRNGGGPPMAPRIFATLLGAPSGQPISRPSDFRPTQLVHRPTVGDGIAAWWEEQQTPDSQALNIRLTIWQASTGRVFSIPTEGEGIHVSVRGGWLTWLTFNGDRFPAVYGVPISELRSP